ncbi:MAG: phosphotransferase family protein [Pseudomonadota bacterium]
MTLTDQPGDVREDDQIDIEKLSAYLRTQDLLGAHDSLSLKQFPGGASNLTYMVVTPDRDMVLRCPPHGKKAKSAHDMVREAKIMRALKPHFPPLPDILTISEGDEVLGAPFYVMERLEGIILRQDIPEALALDDAGVTRLCQNVLDVFVDLHAVDVEAADLGWMGKGEGYTERQITGWSGRWRDALTDDVDAAEDVLAWLEKNKPARDSGLCVIHNDYRFDNVVLDKDDPMKVIGVLDWEMATLGDPLMDLGATLAYWIEADDDQVFQMMRRQPTNAPGMLGRDEMVAYYAEKSGREIPDFTFYEVYGLFRLAVIIQQIWWRFRAGQTTNPAFATFGHAANYLVSRCRRIIEAKG